MSDDRKCVIWSDESSFTLFLRSNQVYNRIMPKEAYNLECLVPTVKHRGGSVMIWAAISWYSAGPIITLVKLLPVTTWTFLVTRYILWSRCYLTNNNAIFRDDSLFIHTAGSVLSWFEEHEDALQHLTWPAQ